MDLIRIVTEFATEEACLNYLEKARWPKGVTCIRRDAENQLSCQSDKITKFSTKESARKNGRKIPARHLYQCQECGYQFTAKTETLFNDSHLPLTKWFIAVTLLTNAKKGMSAKQLQRDLAVSYQTAWYVFHRVREAQHSENGLFGGTVEMDETFIGGRFDPRRHDERQTHKQGVMGIIQRATEDKPSQVVAYPIPTRGAPVIRAAVQKHIANDATIYSDELVRVSSHEERASGPVRHSDSLNGRVRTRRRSCEHGRGILESLRAATNRAAPLGFREALAAVP